MRISIVTACLNNRTTIEDTLKSLVGQSYPDIELIVVDGGSTDGTREIIDRYVGRIARVISEKDRGIYDALNKGMRLASGDVVGFLHADDVLADPAVIGKVAGIFATSKTDSLYGDLVYVSKTDTSRVIRRWRAGTFDRNRMRRGWLPPHPTFYVRRAVYDKHGLFDTSFGIAADYDLMMRFLFDQRISAAYLPEVMVRMRSGGTSNRSLKNLVRKSAEDLRILKRHGVKFAELALIHKNLSKLPQFLSWGSSA